MAPAEQPDRAAVHREALAAADGRGDVGGVADAAEALADALADDGSYETAALLLGGAEVLRGDGLSPPHRNDRALAIVEEALGEVRLAERLADGRRMSHAELVALALGRA